MNGTKLVIMGIGMLILILTLFLKIFLNISCVIVIIGRRGIYGVHGVQGQSQEIIAKNIYTYFKNNIILLIISLYSFNLYLPGFIELAL